ncbi:response regulator transcription factor [Methanocella conradii]|uniref:response regulator transcription factor n=1 Tax=Methanocella conradii TaxID=1175444 RepID=UPI0024B3366B|nr:response regulator [Methanocella conradii]MDI6896813.1 response regulator [Methanocella conradii]
MYKVGIIEDEPDLVKLYELFLEKRYADKLEVVYKAQDGREGVEKNKCSPADIIILDDRMPEVNGVDAAERINDHHPETIFIFTPCWGCEWFSSDNNISHIKSLCIIRKPYSLKLMSALLDNAIEEIERRKKSVEYT